VVSDTNCGMNYGPSGITRSRALRTRAAHVFDWVPGRMRVHVTPSNVKESSLREIQLG
jgi:hypothetical protein